jgi:MFS family permease
LHGLEFLLKRRNYCFVDLWVDFFVLSSLLNAVFGNFAAMISGRFFQGLFGAYSTVVSAAIADMSDLSNVGLYNFYELLMGFCF